MVIKFLGAANGFPAVDYNFDKILAGTAELMAVHGFEALQGMSEIRPKDFENHLLAVSALNKAISKPQLHVAISTAGSEHDKNELTAIARTWLDRMGYGKQPYFIAYHSDTKNKHIHIVTTRVDYDGRKIDSGFERIRGLKVMNQIMGLDEEKSWHKDLEQAAAYRFANIAQFKLILEKRGYTIKDASLIKFGKKLTELDFDKIAFKQADQRRATQLKAIFKKYAPQQHLPGFTDLMRNQFGIELVLHAKDGQPAYGYTVLDHAQKNVYKGGEILSFKLLNESFNSEPEQSKSLTFYSPMPRQTSQKNTISPSPSFTVSISKDVDDESINGPRRRRKRRARTNQR